MTNSLRGLRVTDVERTVVRVPLVERNRPWIEIVAGQWPVVEVLKVTTDAGLVGYGETLPHYTWGTVSDEAVAAVRGRNPADLLGDDSLGPGLQTALYDVVGRALDVPAHRLLGLPQVRDRSPISWWNTKMPPELLAEEARDALAAGYLSHKFKARPWFDVYEQVAAVAAVTPDTYRLDLDWNEMLIDVGTAAPVLARLDRTDRVDIYESPILRSDMDGHRRLRGLTTRPLADHYHATPFGVTMADAYDGFVLTAGAATTIRQGLEAGVFGKPFWLQRVGTGLTTAFTLHLAAVLPGARWPMVTCLNLYTDDLVTEPFAVRGGYVDVPTGPGLGVDCDESAVSRLAMAPPHTIDLPDTILTVCWPGDRAIHYATGKQLWKDALAGNVPAQERGARLHVRVDDGSADFAALRRKALVHPVRS